MNCTLARQHLLASERPDRPPPAPARHLADCAACRDWLGRLVRLERELAQLPVPPSRPPDRLLEQVLHGPDPAKVIRPPFRLRPNPDAAREQARQKLALAFALAASLMVFAIGWWAWPPTPPPFVKTQPASTSDHLLAWKTLRDQHLKGARTPAEKVTGLVTLADKLLKRTRNRQDTTEHRVQMANFFKFLGDDLVEEIEVKVSPGERPALAKSARTQLLTIKIDALRFKKEWVAKHGKPDLSLEQIHEAIRRADERLQRIV